MKRILINDGTIVGEGRRFAGYIVVDQGIIAEIGEGEYTRDWDGRRIDAAGKIVMPGAIDAHVHFRDPGLTAKGDMRTESASAVAGGVTSVLEMPNTVPPAVTIDELDRKFELAHGRMHTNYSFFLGATGDNLLEIKRFYNTGGRLVKLFMGSSTGGMLMTDQRALAALFAEFGGTIAAHCEDEEIIRRETNFYRAETNSLQREPKTLQGKNNFLQNQRGDRATAAIHPLVRPTEACYAATARAVELADRYGTNLHVCHLTTARELTLFQGFDDSQNNTTWSKKITAEACVPHLWFSDADYARLGNRIKCNPAIKTEADREALRNALTNNRIDLIATDHAPHTAAEKERGYWDAPSGIPSVQHAVAVMFTLAAQGVLPIEAVVEKMCHAPALRFGIADRGFLRKGYAADIAIVNPSEEWTVAPSNILSKCGWSPWEGTRLTARVTTTIVNGQIVWDGREVAEEAAGANLKIK